MSQRWFRHYVGLATDQKFGGIARRAKTTTDRAVFVFIICLESAAERMDGGSYCWSADAIAAIAGCETAVIKRVHRELMAAGMLTKTHVSNWGKRQFESDSSRERVKRHRDRQREKRAVSETERNEGVTLPKQLETAPEAEAEADTEIAATLNTRARSRHDLDAIERALRTAAGLVDDPNPKLFDLSPILGLIDAGFDLDAEILPVVRAKAAAMRYPARSWAYFVDAVHDGRASRADAATERPRTGPLLVSTSVRRVADDVIRNPMIAAGAKYFEGT